MDTMLSEKVRFAEALARQRILHHPGLTSPEALDGLANYVASFCDITVDQARAAIASAWPGLQNSELEVRNDERQ